MHPEPEPLVDERDFVFSPVNRVENVVCIPGSERVHAQAAGVIEDVLVRPGSAAEDGTVLIRMSAPLLNARVRLLEASKAEIEKRFASQNLTDPAGARIAKAEQLSRRAAGAAQLIAVSKVQPEARVAAVLDQGHRIFGENRVQEAQGKWPAWKDAYTGVELHLLGPRQTNKARAAMELLDVIHTLDRPKLARTLARLAQAV